MAVLKYGLIGMGRWAREVHIPVLNQIEGAEIVALSSRSEENLKKAAEVAKGEPRLYQDYRQLLQDPEVEAVVICTPNHTHAKIAKEALEAGKHVFCEKPLALTLEEHVELSRLAEERGLVLQVGFELRHAPKFRRLHRMVKEGELGSVGLFWCHILRGPLLPGWRADKSQSGGIIVEVLSHYLDLFNWLSGGRPARLFCRADILGQHFDHDRLSIFVEYESGPRAVLIASFFCPAVKEVKFGAVGDKGAVEASIIERRMAVAYEDGRREELHFPPPEGVEEPGYPGTYFQHLSFIRCVKEGEAPEAGARESALALAMALAAERSVESGGMVEVPEPGV
ncbi:MAG TPA: Gfo/Idh/MocA family oxidoreductase [Armatimonadetes bacterium]|nr:Gfo/Idh/MocA family oxidoreductase [Armatimonadota bacterium]